MRSFPPLPDLRSSEPSADILRGHLWLLELVHGTDLRFRMDDSGLLRFGDPHATYTDREDVPVALRPALRHVRTRFERKVLRASVDEPAEIVFFGVATHHCGVDYDWERLPAFLGTDVWSAGSQRANASGISSSAADSREGSFRPPDAAAAIFEGVGLDPINAVERERNARDFDPDSYSTLDSAWYDGPAAGVVVKNKRGGRGRIVSDLLDSELDATDDPDRLVERYVTPDRLERAVSSMEREGTPPAVGSLADRVVEIVARETPIRFGDRHPGASLDPDQFRVAAFDSVRAFLD